MVKLPFDKKLSCDSVIRFMATVSGTATGYRTDPVPYVMACAKAPTPP